MAEGTPEEVAGVVGKPYRAGIGQGTDTLTAPEMAQLGGGWGGTQNDKKKKLQVVIFITRNLL